MATGSQPGSSLPTERIDSSLRDLDLRDNREIIDILISSQRQAVEAVAGASAAIDDAVAAAANRLLNTDGRLVLVGAGASGRLAVQDGAEMWPTYGWPHERLLLGMAGGDVALTNSVEGVEDNSDDARMRVVEANIRAADVVLAIAASGRSAWTCAWAHAAREAGALTIGFSNNPETPLLSIAEHAIWLDSGVEVLAGSTRMAAGTAQKVALNVFSTTLMIRLNRTFGNLMVDMAAVNRKLDGRRIRLLQGVLPDIGETAAREALATADGWVKLAALVAGGLTAENGRRLLELHNGSLRCALKALS